MRDTLATILNVADVALYEFGDYIVAVGDARPIQDGFQVTIGKEALPPHIIEYHDTLDAVETSLDGKLGYHKGTPAWLAREEEE